MNRSPLFSLLTAGVFGAIAAGLSSCTSVAESSASSASISSLSASSAGALAMNDAYHDDIRVATSTAIASAATTDELLHQIAQIATGHGIADWETEAVTYLAIGEGMREAGLAETDVRERAAVIAGGNAAAEEKILVGFRV